MEQINKPIYEQALISQQNSTGNVEGGRTKAVIIEDGQMAE